MSSLSISYSNRISTITRLASAQNYDGTILTWSSLDNILRSLYHISNLPNYSFYTNRVFSSTWLCIQTPPRATTPFQLNTRQIKENIIMSKIRIRIE